MRYLCAGLTGVAVEDRDDDGHVSTADGHRQRHLAAKIKKKFREVFSNKMNKVELWMKRKLFYWRNQLSF